MNKNTKKKCPVCGSDKIKTIIKDKNLNYKSQNILIKDFKSDHCFICKESFVDEKFWKKITPLLRDFHRKVDGLLSGIEIANIRKSFKMSQKSFSILLGCKDDTFKKCESGYTMQPKELDNLLRILKEFPNTIDIIKRNYKNE